MKANEIQIGDWVYNHRNWECPIVEIHKNSAVVIARHYGEEEFLLSDLRPIPLTAEILEKNGFEEKTESNPFVYYLFKDGDNSVSLEHTYDTTDKEDYWACSIGNRLCDVCTISMHYIHELQHALKLCRIDKDIVL